MKIEGELREADLSGLELIGEGGNSSVYRLDPDRVIKVFHPDCPLDMVEYESRQSREAYLAGVPCAASYGMVRVGERYGIIYEMLGKKDMLTLMAEDREHLRDYMERFAEQVRRMHTREVRPGSLPDTKRVFEGYLKRLEGRLCTAEEIARLQRVLEMIPDRTTFIHGDCHPGNVMMKNGRPVFVDVSSCGYGHPIFDLVGMCSIYLFAAGDEDRRRKLPVTRDFSGEECRMIWEVFLRSYLQMDDQALLEHAEPEELVWRVRDAVNRFVDGAPQFDDLTMLCLKYRGNGSAA